MLLNTLRWCWDGRQHCPVLLVKCAWTFTLRKEIVEHNQPKTTEQLDRRLLNGLLRH